MKRKEIFQGLPMIVIAVVIIYTWFNILTTDYFATLKHQFALALFLVNVGLYLINFKYAVYLSGFFLLLASFNLLAIWPNIISSSYFIKIGGKEISTPEIQWNTFFILLLYLFCNATYLIDSNAEKKSDNQ